MKLLKLAILLSCVSCLCAVYGQFTKKDQNILSRRRRYLSFPKGANFVFQVVFVKVIMKKVPKGVQYLTEFDFPYPLPSDARLFSEFKHGHRIHKRQLFEDIAQSLDRYGLNGTACVKRIICDAQEFIPFRGKSLVKDLLSAIFSNSDLAPETEADPFQNSCQSLEFDCPHPFLDLIWKSLTNT